MIDTLTWKTARIVGYPNGDIWAVVAAEHFDNPAGALDTVAAASALMTHALPAGGLVSEYLFLEELERAALAAEIATTQARREFLRCSVAPSALSAAQARVDSVRYRYVSDTLASLEALRQAQGGPVFGPVEAVLAMRVAQGQPDDAHTPLSISWEMVP